MSPLVAFPGGGLVGRCLGIGCPGYLSPWGDVPCNEGFLTVNSLDTKWIRNRGGMDTKWVYGWSCRVALVRYYAHLLWQPWANLLGHLGNRTAGTCLTVTRYGQI